MKREGNKNEDPDMSHFEKETLFTTMGYVTKKQKERKFKEE